MTNPLLHKAIKRGTLSHLILCALVSLSATLQAAASIGQSDPQESYNYTLQNYSDQVSPIQEETYLDIEEMPRELPIILQAASKDKDHHDVPQLLAMVAEDVQNRQYYKYLFASNGLLPSSEAQQKAHDLNYHLVKAPPGPVIWQVLSFLDQRSYLEIKGLIVPKDTQLCFPCSHMAMHLFGKKLPVHKAGCQGQPVPTTAAPASAIACFYSNRFTDQQQRLVISQIGNQAFPDPRKPITSPSTHDNNLHKRTSQPLMQPLPPGQLLIPANGQCLYTTIIIGYLLPVTNDVDEATKRMDQLFGSQPAYYINQLDKALQNPTHYLSYLHSDAFSNLVTTFMTRMQIKKGTWGGPQEIQTIATKLKVNIQAYYPDPSNPTSLVQSDLTKPAQEAADITLHIVRDKVHPAEVLTQVEKASAKDNPHYQHYRLKYALPPSSPAPVPPSTPLPILHRTGSTQNNQPHLVAWFQAAKTGNRTLLQELYDNYNINVNDSNENKYTALLWSAENGHLDMVKYLVQRGANMHAKNKWKNTPLLLGAYNGHLDVVQYLVQKGVSIHVKNKWKNTALLLSASKGHIDCVKYLVQQGAHINITNSKGNTALLLSVENGHVDYIKYLLQQGADIHVQNKWGNTALLLSAYKGHLDCLKYLLQQGAHINTKNKRGNTALLLSAQEGYLACLKCLHVQGADINTKNKNGNTALLLSAQGKHLACLKYLHAQGADINTRNMKGNTALIQSVRFGRVDNVKYLVQQGADIQAKNRWGNTALLLSVQKRRLAYLKFLLQQGTDINIRDNDGNTALLWSARKGHIACLKYLVQQGADIQDKNKNGNTTLLWSARNGHLACIKYLVQQSAHLQDKNKWKNMALLLSAKKGNLACVKYLVQQGADINTRDDDGNTALLLSASKGHLDCLKWLTQQGANTKIKNKWGNTALLLSVYKGCLACVTFLVQQGTDIQDKNENGYTALLFSADKGHLACLKYLLQQGADIQDKNEWNNTALLLSAQKGHLACLKWLTQQGANIQDRNRWQNTALLLSAQHGHLACLKYLVQQGANIYARNKWSSTALLLSAYKGHLDIVRYLLQQGADIQDKNENGYTALLLSAEKGHLACLKYLLQQGADIQDKNKNGNTALLWSACKGHPDCLKYLLQQGADINTRDNDGKTALLLSAQEGHLDCVKLLLTSVNLHHLHLQGINFSQVTLPRDLSGVNFTGTTLPKNLSGKNFTDAKLPKDLSNRNLAHANLTGQRFTATNFEGTQLEGVILTNTLCDYQQCFQDHLKVNKLSGGPWYRHHLPKDLKSIAQVYPHLSQHTHKAALLQIASGLAYLPYWKGTEFYIKVYYWSCKLLLLKKQLNSRLGAQLVCALADDLEDQAEDYCWHTNYLEHQVEKTKKAPHHKFDQYLKTFQARLQQYNCTSKESWGYSLYKANIEKNIQGLQKTYLKLTTPKRQQEALDIAFQLSTLYQHQHLPFLLRYLFLQNKLIQLKMSAGVEIHYDKCP